MKITRTKIKDILIIEPEIHEDQRGWFAETYHQDKLKEFGVNVYFVQHNHSFTSQKGTLRGLHFQKHPHAQSKLVRCIRGAVLDVAVDLRKNSPTYKQWIAIELSEDNKKKLFIPQGFAHGFLTLTDNVEFQYKVDNYYHKESERNIHFSDPSIDIEWGCKNPILSETDKQAPFLDNCDINF